MSPYGKSSDHFLSLIVPSYKQAETIIDNLKLLQEVLDAIRYDYEIIVVVDGMVDKTFQELKKYSWPNVSCYAYEENRGKAYAIRFGMKKAKGDYVMFIDAGFDIDPNSISMLVEHLEWYDADIIVGSKRHPASKVDYTVQRKILSTGYFLFVKALFNISVKDTQVGIKIFRKKALEHILPRLIEKRFAGDLEMLVVARKLGYDRIYEAPIKLDYQFSTITSAATWKSISGILIDTIAIAYRTYILRYYDRPHTRFVKPEKVMGIINGKLK